VWEEAGWTFCVLDDAILMQGQAVFAQEETVGIIFLAGISTCFLMIFTLCLFMVGIMIVRQQLQFGRQACSTTGVIVDFNVRRVRRMGRGRSRMVVVFHPVIQFQRVDGLFAGQQMTCELSIGSYPPLDRVGKRVPLLYIPSNPQGAQINTFRWRWFGVCLWFLISLVGLLMAFGILSSIWR